MLSDKFLANADKVFDWVSLCASHQLVWTLVPFWWSRPPSFALSRSPWSFLFTVCSSLVFIIRGCNITKGRFQQIVITVPPLGGPHSQFPAGWNTTTAGLVKLGFAVLMGEEISIFLCINKHQLFWSPGVTLLNPLSSGVSHYTCLPSELQRIYRIWSGQHLVPDWSNRKPGCEGCAGTGRSFTFFSGSTANCDGKDII